MRYFWHLCLDWLRSVILRLHSCFESRAELIKETPATPDLGPPADPGNLLRRRMETLHLDLAQLARCDPATANELQRLCTMCERRIACAVDLEHPSADAAWAEWRDYCPNATKLNELRIRQAMQSPVSGIPSGEV
jgi:hypothetical protein